MSTLPGCAISACHCIPGSKDGLIPFYPTAGTVFFYRLSGVSDGSSGSGRGPTVATHRLMGVPRLWNFSS